jgi:hypothetical protein
MRYLASAALRWLFCLADLTWSVRPAGTWEKYPGFFLHRKKR